MNLDVIVKTLRGVDDFVGVARCVVDNATRLLELHRCAVAMCSTTGQPVIVVDNDPHLTDVERQRHVTGGLGLDPLYRVVVETHAPVVGHAPRKAMHDPEVHLAVLPLLDLHGVLGTIHCARARSYSPLLHRDLSVLASHVSVRLAQLGISRTGGSPTLHQLSDRQYEVARQVARGFGNHQIADALGISENTIKKHLKDVFARLGVANRTELATRFVNAGRRSDLPLGTSRVGSIVITRGDGYSL